MRSRFIKSLQRDWSFKTFICSRQRWWGSIRSGDKSRFSSLWRVKHL